MVVPEAPNSMQLQTKKVIEVVTRKKDSLSELLLSKFLDWNHEIGQARFLLF